jgi:hypothetical protein
MEDGQLAVAREVDVELDTGHAHFAGKLERGHRVLWGDG